MMKVLVVYFSQSGQMLDILTRFLAPFKARGHEVYEHKIEVEEAFPFPWNLDEFFNEFPETVQQYPRSIKHLKIDESLDYDLVVLGFQPWFLSPSQPIQAFLKSLQANVLQGKRVITIQGVRNMWIESHKDMSKLLDVHAVNHIANIVLADRHSNLTSLKTIMKWMLTGNKGPYEKLPAAGVSEDDISQCTRWGEICENHVQEGKEDVLQRQLVMDGAVFAQFPIYLVEFNGKRIFRLWSKFISRKGGREQKERMGRVRTFKYYLFFMLYFISPVPMLLFRFFNYLRPRYCRKILEPYVLLEKNRTGSNQKK